MREVSDLLHHSAQLSGGGEVLVLNTGALITSEDKAMLGAMDSRSVGGIRKHLTRLGKSGSGNFMEQFYVGYGHQSIGDMGEVFVSISGVSMLTAKAIQHFPLYNGQEASTRYIDFASQPFVDPVGSTASVQILENWRAFYLKGLERMQIVLAERYPFDVIGDGDLKKYAKAINARAFDTMRSFLPAGASTNLTWTGTIRQFGDRLPWLRNHPLPEVREVAEVMEGLLLKEYPHSFTDRANDPDWESRHKDREWYAYMAQQGSGYFIADASTFPVFALTHDAVRPERMREYADVFGSRPRGIELPWDVRECGTAEFSFLLDFASFRDLERHRSVTVPMPLLSEEYGFEPWYLNELPDDLRAEAMELLARQLAALQRLELEDRIDQYYIPMGYRVPIRITGDLRGHTYLVERRARNDVHPTLHHRASQMAEVLTKNYGPHGLVLHLESEPSQFSLKRGEQDIVERDVS
ncbi:MAG: Thymidylate synthase thyX [Parcubacteria bacterium C7867-008]|nr:MAG: Thymidylate synthase thyX [Parcubacteria bacterium C7867-008]